MTIITILILVYVMYAVIERDVPVHIQTVALEARSQSIEGRAAVARVIQNRAKKWIKTLDQICYAQGQFSCWQDGKSTQRSKPSLSDYSRAYSAWQIALVSDHEVWSNAMYYKRVDCDSPWFEKAEREGKIKKVCKIMDHEFYEEVNK